MNFAAGDNIWVWLVGLIMTTGTAKVIFDGFRDFLNRPSKSQQHVATIDASIITVARARDELVEDNQRLRDEITELRQRHAEDRTRWENEKTAFRREIAELQERIRLERDEAERRYTALLERLSQLSARHAPTEGSPS